MSNKNKKIISPLNAHFKKERNAQKLLFQLCKEEKLEMGIFIGFDRNTQNIVKTLQKDRALLKNIIITFNAPREEIPQLLIIAISNIMATLKKKK